MKKTMIEKQEKQLRAKLHVLKTRAGMTDDEYRTMLAGSYGVESSVDMSAHQLIDLINTLERKTDGSIDELDRWRKRVTAAVAGYLKSAGKESSIDLIKAVACRAAGCGRFNAMRPLQKFNKVDLLKKFLSFFVKVDF
jgi:hypothetical protein